MKPCRYRVRRVRVADMRCENNRCCEPQRYVYAPDTDRIDSDVFCDQFHTKEDTLACRCGSLSIIDRSVCNSSLKASLSTFTSNKSSVAKNTCLQEAWFERTPCHTQSSVSTIPSCSSSQAHYSRNMIACNPALRTVSIY